MLYFFLYTVLLAIRVLLTSVNSNQQIKHFRLRVVVYTFTHIDLSRFVGRAIARTIVNWWQGVFIYFILPNK